MPQTLANPVRLARLLDTHPYSIPGVHLCSDDGDWAFISEGGSLAFFHQPENLDQFTWGPGNYALPLNPGQTKRIPIGFPGVQPAEMLLDPAADFSDDVNPGDDTPGPEDANDLIYIAGGRLGLWVMEAYPGPGYLANFAARIDDSQDLDPTTQKSSRYCTGVEFVRLGTVDYLVAIFGFAKDSRLRFYRLIDVRQLVIDAALIGGDGFGAEIAPVHEVILGVHPNAPPWAYHTSWPNGTNPNAYAEPFALDVDIDADVVLGEAALYVAMGTHGIVRVKASATGTGAITSTTTWGPMFGTDCPGNYDDDDSATPAGQNASGFAADRYVNIDWAVVDRNEHFDEVTRSDPPVFLDVAVQNDADGHFLYAAVDHLAWVRFDLDDTWTPAIPIDHHEGEDVSIQDNSLFPKSNDVWFGASGVLKETAWDPPLVRAIAFQANFGFNLEIVAMPFCRELDVTLVERTPGVYESVLVALYKSRPWNLSSRGGRGPGVTYDNWFTRSGNTPVTAAGLLQGLGATAFHWTTDITSSNSSQPSFDGYFIGGGSDMYVPPVHSHALMGQLGGSV